MVRLLLFAISLFLSLSIKVSSLSSNKKFKNLLLSYSLAWQHNAATHIFCFKKVWFFFVGVRGLDFGLGSVGGGVVRVTLVSLTYNSKKMTATTAIFITHGCLSWVLLKTNWIYLRLIKPVDVNQAADKGSILCASVRS